MNWSAGRKLVVCAWVTVILTLSVGASALWVANHLSSRLSVAVNESARHQFLAGQIAADAERLENLERQLAIATMLQQAGAQLQLEWNPVAHQLCSPELAVAKFWLKTHFAA